MIYIGLMTVQELCTTFQSAIVLTNSEMQPPHQLLLSGISFLFCPLTVFFIIILYDSSVCPFKRTVCLHYFIAVWIYNHSYSLMYIDHWNLCGKLGKGHSSCGQVGICEVMKTDVNIH